MADAKPAKNTDTEIWRKQPDDYYSPSIHVTKNGGIGINVGGLVCVRSIEEWHSMIATIAADRKRIEELEKINKVHRDLRPDETGVLQIIKLKEDIDRQAATIERLEGVLEKAANKLKVCKAHIQQMDSEYVPSEEMQMKYVITQTCISIDAVVKIARQALGKE